MLDSRVTPNSEMQRIREEVRIDVNPVSDLERV
jgi:hypothetical protein